MILMYGQLMKISTGKLLLQYWIDFCELRTRTASAVVTKISGVKFLVQKTLTKASKHGRIELLPALSMYNRAF